MRKNEEMFSMRNILIAIGIVMIGAAVWMHGTARDPQAEVVLAIYGAILVLGIWLDRWRYRPDVNRRQPGWQPTDEKFIDPGSGKRIQVWFNPETGQRDYRADSDAV